MSCPAHQLPEAEGSQGGIRSNHRLPLHGIHLDLIFCSESERDSFISRKRVRSRIRGCVRGCAREPRVSQLTRGTGAPARQVLHDTRRHQADTCPELRRGLSEDTENYQADSEIITRAWLGYAASGTRPSPTSHNAIRDRHAPQRKLVLPPSQFPTRADLTTTPMTEVEELPPGGDRQSREGDYLSLVTHTS